MITASAHAAPIVRPVICKCGVALSPQEKAAYRDRCENCWAAAPAWFRLQGKSGFSRETDVRGGRVVRKTTSGGSQS